VLPSVSIPSAPGDIPPSIRSFQTATKGKGAARESVSTRYGDRPRGNGRVGILLFNVQDYEALKDGDNMMTDDKLAGKKKDQDCGPRKVLVGTSMFAMWGNHPGLDLRLTELGALIDEMDRISRQRYDRGLDIAALPEVAVSGGLPFGPRGAFALEGMVQSYFAEKARQLSCYIVLPMFLREQKMQGEEISNAAVLISRSGEVVGIYRKVHPVAGFDDAALEGGCVPGKSFPVFVCDFGKVGLQICYDMEYDDGWEALERKGAELVVWTTQSPGQIRPSSRAWAHRYFVLTSTWRHNASLFDPTGHLIRAITEKKERVFVEEIDLDYVLLGWQPKLRNGEALREKFGGRVGFRYSEAEDEGIFWSNDKALSIRQMTRELGLITVQQKIEQDRVLQNKARGASPT
jgi:predicted amidohydrolase